MEARITQTATGFVAQLTEKGGRVVAANVLMLAAALYDLGIRADTAHCGDWRDGDETPQAGSAIALKTELRRLAGGLNGNTATSRSKS